MSIKKANDFFRQKDYVKAIQAYRSIGSGEPLFSQAQFNIKIAERLLATKKSIGNPPQTKNIPIEQPLVSIIMPVFNVAPYLDASILSVLSQTYQNIELIIVNDASTDNSLDIIKMFADKDARIKIINLEFNTHGGAGMPSNIGIDTALGEYIAFADSDDMLHKNAIEKMVNLACQNKTDVVIADFNNFDDDGRNTVTAYDKQKWKNLPLEQCFNPKEYISVLRLSPVPWRKLYKRSFLNNNNIRFPEGDYFYEDNPLHWYVLTQAKRVILTDNVVAYHRMGRAGQTMGMRDDAYKFAAHFCHFNAIKNYFLNKHFFDELYWKELINFVYHDGILGVIDRQTNPKFKKLMEKRFSQIASDIASLANIEHNEIIQIHSDFYERCHQYNNNYPTPDLAIVIPVYNCADLLVALMDSLLKVELSTQIILIDDGSTDASASLCRRFADEYEYIYFIQQKNKGMGSARNLAIPLLSAEYTFFVDADTEINPTTLKESVLSARKHQADLTLLKHNIHIDNKALYQDRQDNSIWDKLLKAKTNEEKKLLAVQLIDYPCNRIIKTTTLHDENIFFGKTFYYHCIPYHWHSIIAAKNIRIFDKPVCHYRHVESDTHLENASDPHQSAILESNRYTNHQIQRYNEFPLLFSQWEQFVSRLLIWGKNRIPEDKLAYYCMRQEEILTELKREKVLKKYKIPKWKKKTLSKQQEVIEKEVSLIKESGLFDDAYYLNNSPDLKTLDIDLVKHYVEYGASEGRNPNEYFDTTFYLSNYPDINPNAINPFVHYIKYGMQEDRKPNENFDPIWYKENYPDINHSDIVAFEHFLSYGKKENRFQNKKEKLEYERLISTGFNTAFYREFHDDLRSIANENFDFILHYIRHGKFEERRIKYRPPKIDKNTTLKETKADRQFNIELKMFKERMIDSKAIESQIFASLTTKTPLSLIRFYDGEGAFYKADNWSNSLLHERMAYYFGEGRQYEKKDANHIKNLLLTALKTTDIIGIPNLDVVSKIRRFCKRYAGGSVDDLPYIEKQYNQTIDSRGAWRILSALELVANALCSDAFFCSKDIHYELLLNGGLYRILSKVDNISIITSQPVENYLEELFNLSVKKYEVPGRAVDNTSLLSTNHYPTVFHHILDELESDKDNVRGQLFLVGAGPLGKEYCRKVKELGGIAIDIGAVFDSWINFHTRPEHTINTASSQFNDRLLLTSENIRQLTDGEILPCKEITIDDLPNRKINKYLNRLYK